MKTSRFIYVFCLLVLACACKPKMKMTALPAPMDPPIDQSSIDCSDTMSTAVFTNTKTMELRLTISEKTSVREGNIIVNNWKSVRTIPIPAGDSSLQILRCGKQFMYTVYGPVSTNVNGLGVVAEEKFTLKPCEWRRIKLY